MKAQEAPGSNKISDAMGSQHSRILRSPSCSIETHGQLQSSGETLAPVVADLPRALEALAMASPEPKNLLSEPKANNSLRRSEIGTVVKNLDMFFSN